MNNLYLLGVGTPTPTKGRFGTCYVLELNGNYLMIDCGPAATDKLVKAGLFPTQIECLLFTHHHFDHNSDYPCFFLSRWDQSVGKEKKLKIFGPAPTKSMTDRLFGDGGVFYPDINARIQAPVSQCVFANRGGQLPRPGPDVEVRDISSGDVMACAGTKISTVAVHHVEPWLESLAYRIDGDGLSIKFAGDTGPCDALCGLAAGCDVLVVNCWDHQQTMDENGEAPGQTGTLDAARMAEKAGAKKLVLTHMGKRLAGAMERAMKDMKDVYSGEIIFGAELMTVQL